MNSQRLLSCYSGSAWRSHVSVLVKTNSTKAQMRLLQLRATAGQKAAILRRHNSTKASKPAMGSLVPVKIYDGELARAAKIMKLASVASLVGACASVPFFFGGESDIPSAARTILALTTLGMTGSSTAIVTWALKPYITKLSALQNIDRGGDKLNIGPDTPLLIETMTFLARPRTRLIFPGLLDPSTQLLTSWVARKPTEELELLAREILDTVNEGRKKDIVELAKSGDTFYAHVNGPISEEMRQVLATSPSQE